MDITQEKLHEIFEYRDGVLYWKDRRVDSFKTNDKRGPLWSYKRWAKRFLGKPAGFMGGNGLMYVNYKCFMPLHRVIFLYHHGWLPEIVDHIDRDSSNNLIENLRPADKSKNSMNSRTRRDSSTGVRNVVKCHQTGKFSVSVTANGETRWCGRHDTIQEASQIAEQERRRLHGEFFSS